MRYKLIKTYPGSPSLGRIVIPYSDYIYIAEEFYGSLQFTIANEFIEKFPEFWQPDSEWVNISELTNSEIGSIHWLNTILGFHLHTGEHLSNIDRFYIQGERIQEGSREIMEYFKDKLR